MASCANCQNLLPRTVDRCPVCGVPQATEGTEEAENVAPAAPAWSMETEEDLGSSDTGGPQLPEYSRPNAPSPMGLDPALGGHELPRAPAQPAPRTGAASPVVAAPEPAELSGSAALLPTVEDDARIVRAASNRVEGDFKIGKKPQHSLAVIVASVAALVCVVGGAAAGSMLPAPSETLAYNDDQIIPGEPLDDATIARWQESQGGAFVTIELDGCSPQNSPISGVALDPRIVLAPASDVESDVTPTIISQDGTRYEGRTVGLLSTSGFAVVRLNNPLPTSFAWGPMLNVREGMDVQIASFVNSEASLSNGTISQLRRTSTGVVGMDVMPKSPQGSVVLDGNSLVIGVVTRTGTFAADSDELSPKVSNAVLNQAEIEPICPAPEPVEGDQTEGTDQTDGTDNDGGN